MFLYFFKLIMTYHQPLIIKLIDDVPVAVCGGVDEPGLGWHRVVEPHVAEVLGHAGRGEVAGEATGDTVEASHQHQCGQAVVDILERRHVRHTDILTY